jgi:two-component system, response regulator YesN
MYKVLVVDDEPKVRRGLTRLIPELDPEWTVIGDAKNGIEALEKVRKYMPDLVITDIRMPLMNGLDLLNSLKDYPVHVVILSGYGYFEYAKTAIRFGAFDYLLKPLKPAEVRELLIRLKKQIQMQAPQTFDGGSQIHYAKLWKDWLMGVEESEEYCQKLQGQLPSLASYRIFVVEIDQFDALVSEEQWGDRQLVVFTVQNMIQEILDGREGMCCQFLFSMNSQLYFLLINQQVVLQDYEMLIEEVKRMVEISISIGIGDESEHFAQLPTLFTNTREALLNKWIYGDGKVHDYRDLFLSPKLQVGYPSDLDNSVIVSLREGNLDKAQEYLAQFVGTILQKNVSYQVFHRFCLQLLSSAVRVIYEQKITSLVFQDSRRPYELFDRNFTVNEYIHFMNELLAAIITSVEWKKQQKRNRTLETAVNFIHQSYTKDLSLDEVAGQIHMNSSYFSSFFKQEIGLTFIEYLTQLRIDKAKALMIDPDLKLYEIAGMVGYQDVKYFSRLFKKAEGVTPGEYRQFFYRKEEEDGR